MDDAGLVGAILDLAGLGVLGRRSVTSMVTVPTLGFGIRPRGRESAELADDLHGVRGGDDYVEVEIPGLTSAARSSKPTMSAPAALAVSALSPWAKNSNANRLAGTGRKNDGTAHHLVGLARASTRG